MNTAPRRRVALWIAAGLVVLLAIVLVGGSLRFATLAVAGVGLHPPTSLATTRPTSDTFRVGTFNIDGGQGTDGRLDLPRIASVVDGCDLIGLQEVHGRSISESRDQAEILGELTHLPYLFAPAERQWWHDSFGVGVLSRLPCEAWERLPISGAIASNHRCLLLMNVRLGQQILHVIVAHLPTTHDLETQHQIIEQQFFNTEPPVLLLGDLNAKPGTAWVESIRHHDGVVDGVGLFAEAKSPQHVDWIFARGLVCTDGGTIDQHASDHPFYWNEFRVK